MQTTVPVNVNSSRASHTVIDQSKNNTTLWVGHLPADPSDHYGGQTFTCQQSGKLDGIQLFASAVHSPGDLRLTLHEFDPETRAWGRPLGESSVSIDRDQHGQWIAFPLGNLELSCDRQYGFKLSTDKGMIGLGEAVAGTTSPFNGLEWQGDSSGERGSYFSYFSLAYKVSMV